MDSKNFVSKPEDFVDFKTWEVVDYSIGATNPTLMDAHMGENDNYSRRVYKSSSTTIKGAEYSQEAIFDAPENIQSERFEFYCKTYVGQTSYF